MGSDLGRPVCLWSTHARQDHARDFGHSPGPVRLWYESAFLVANTYGLFFSFLRAVELETIGRQRHNSDHHAKVQGTVNDFRVRTTLHVWLGPHKNRKLKKRRWYRCVFPVLHHAQGDGTNSPRASGALHFSARFAMGFFQEEETR
jgi:hypothetical protein